MNLSSPTFSVQKPRRVRKRYIIIVGVILALAILLAFVLSKRVGAPTPHAESQSQAQVTEETPTSVNGKYMFSGTIVLARAVEKYANGDYGQPFSKFSTFNPKQYDGWLADWECPSSSKIDIPYAQQIANLQFNCRPEWMPEVSKYFTFMNLANNHSGDLGEETFEETQKHLQKAGIQVVGNYDPAATKDICEVMTTKVRLKMPDGSEKKGTLPIAFCAWHYFFRDPAAGEIETMQRYSKIMPVFGLMHVGVEYVATAGTNQQAVARKIIDNGAEFVIGNSPHWVQNTEVYKGKPIIYSTGNFIFDQLEAETNRGVSIAVTMKVPYDDNVAKWLALSDQCRGQYDTCLEEAEKQGLTKINAEFSYAPIANTTGVRTVTQKAPASIQQAVEQRMNWSKTLKELGQ